ncbi:MAG: aldo/keto reductase [Verrucomicrobiae bacterium]|nr:aldo/keto reductase [Verrucomicrobiae bacterium]MCX7721909.1 aldo/keto reductase [Verrucomicrobiae bacterium]
MGALNETFELWNGVKIPKLALGTWQMPPGETTYKAVLFALQHGYRHIDTAYAYGNEASVGKAVRDSGLARADVFVTTKLPAEVKSYEGALEYFERTMANLSLGYVDLYLIHAPWPWHRKGEDFTLQNIEVWKAFEHIYHNGQCRAIGVSNFDVRDLRALMANCSVKPMANQIKFHIGHTQPELTQFCQENGILVQAYSPLATGKIFRDQRIAPVAKKYGRTVAQICIRYALQKGLQPIPKSVHPERILEDADVDFEISAEDVRYLDSLGAQTTLA